MTSSLRALAIVLGLAASACGPGASVSLTVVATGDGHGAITSSPSGIDCGATCEAVFPGGSVVTLTAAPAAGSTFGGWSGDCAGADATVAVTLDSSRACAARFDADMMSQTFTLTITRAGSGSGTITSTPSGIDCGATCSADFASGASVTLTAAPAAGSTFAGWSGDCAGASATATVTMNAARACTATFSAQGTQTFALAVSGQGSGSGTIASSPSGIDCGATCSASFASGTTVTLTATPAAGSIFTVWSGDCAGTSATATVVMSAARDCVAVFTRQSFGLDVTLAGTGVGSVASSPSGIACTPDCLVSFTAGTSVMLTATPAVGSVFSGWSGDCASAGASTTATVTLSAARACTATFDLERLTLSVATTGPGTGTITSSPSGINCSGSCSADFNYGTSVTLTAAPASGSTFAGWSGACSGGPVATVAMTAAASCTATFFVPATHLAFPQMPSHGQPNFPKLQLVTITFGAYPYQSFVESFGNFVVSSEWLQAVTQDWGPITATHLAKVNLPASDYNLGYPTALLNNLGGAIPFPSDPTGVVYLFYQPSPCSTGGGYHSTVTYNGQTVAYAVALNCSDGKSAEGVASHEIAEVLTDGYLGGMSFDGGQAPWIDEVGDVCNSAPWWMEGGYRFEPIWSNSAAASGASPCVPWAGGHPYMNVSPSPSAPQTVAAGGSVTFTLTGWSTAAVPAWSLRADPDGYAAQGFAATPSFTSTTINNGTTSQLTLHVPAGTPSGASATLRIHSILPDVVDGVSGFAGDWPVEVIAQ